MKPAFPALGAPTQAVARAYGAVCTPDFFGYDKDRKLKFRAASWHEGEDCCA